MNWSPPFDERVDCEVKEEVKTDSNESERIVRDWFAAAATSWFVAAVLEL